MRPTNRRALLLTGGLVALLAIAVPVIAADHSPPAEPPGQAKAEKAKADKGPEIAATLRGTVEQSADEKGRPTFTMTIDGTTWELSAGPKWFWRDNNPLSAHVGKTVEVAGTHHEGETDLDVETVDGTALREAGKPPWAGGPKVVGAAHPGYKAWKAEGKPGNWLGRDAAPGQNKDKSAEGGDGTSEP